MRYSFHAHRRGCSSCGTGLESGFTLVEMIVSVAIMLIIVTPLASAMVIGYRVTDQSGANLQASLNRDQATTRWAADVGSVDATGVSYTTTRACGATEAGNPAFVPGTLYVNFNSTKLSSAAITTVRRVSYWITGGSGKDLAFERRECSGPVASIALDSFRSTIVADQIGTDGNGTSLIFAPNGQGTDPCTEFMCGANLVGRYSFSLQAPRRAFGVGTPLEIGTLYSSALTRQGGVDQRFRYVHYTTAGTAGLIEQLYNQKLSLAPGLGSSTEMAVDFKVQQRTTGKWLNRDASNNLVFTAALGPTSGWIPAAYSTTTEQWALSGINAGTDTDSLLHQNDPLAPATIDAGGEYRVYSRITEKSSSGGALTPKEYGGANGFPMWFDWRPDQAVFVSPNGLDTNTGRVNATTGVPQPVKTIQRGLALARDANAPTTPTIMDAPVPEVLVQAGRYGGQIQVTSSTVASNTTIQGGHTANWLRAGPDSKSAAPPAADLAPRLSFIDGGQATASSPPIGMVVDGVTGLRVRQMEINSYGGVGPVVAQTVDPATWSSYGLQALNGAGIELQNSGVTAKSPLNWPSSGSTATSGGVQPVACSGAQGGLHSTSTNTTWNASNWNGLTWETDCTGGSTGDPTSPISRRGGTGGAGGGGTTFCGSFGGGSSGANGGSGATPSGGGSGGGGGNGGAGACDPGDGQRGKSGVGGAGGTQGAEAYSAASATSWLPSVKTRGNDGKPGGGGGGSGGGGGNYTVNEAGRSGGTGGNGGKGGIGGGPGRSGGSAFALYIWGTSTIRIVNSGVGTATAGRGENGGQGGRGGFGGAGGAAFASQSYGGDTAGAGGGGGGGGGAGGNGGDGGISAGIYLGTGASQPTGGTATATGVVDVANPSWLYFNLGTGGAGGTGGTVAPLGGGAAAGGAGPGGPGGVPSSSCGLCTSIFNFTIEIGHYTAESGEDGSAGQAASAGRNGTAGPALCYVWTLSGPTGGSCTRTTNS